MLKVIDHTFTVQKVHGGGKKIPIQAFCELQLLFPRWHICDSDYLFEGYHLHSTNQSHDVYVARRHRPEKGSYHHQRPYCAGNESLLFLFIF
jgi:hypothetical protein